ncbi:hypothetical protein Tco_0774424 [Tanacetum coccineum]|uniref:Uncharacterized protein n=1 Tax=Tanacetum coccineum TaxID=301880 RepID=A0ABQ4ZSH8_9ASTR
MLAICNAATSGRRKKQIPVLYNHPQSKIEAAKCVSLKRDTGFQTGHSVKETQSSSAKDTNPSQTPSPTPVVVRMHKVVQQETGGPTSLGVTREEGFHLQLSSVVSSSLTKPVYSASTILHSKFASRHDASATSTAEADLGKTNHNDSVSQQQGIVKGTKTISFDHIFVGTDPHVLVEKNKSASEGLETVLTKPATGKGAIYIEKEIEFVEEEFNTSPDLSSLDDTKKEIKLKDLSKLVPNLEVDFIDLDSPEGDEPIII